MILISFYLTPSKINENDSLSSTGTSKIEFCKSYACLELWLTNFYSNDNIEMTRNMAYLSRIWNVFSHLDAFPKGVNHFGKHLKIEVYKTKSNLNPNFMKEIFIMKNTTYQLRNEYSLLLPKVRTTLSGLESISYLESRLRSHLLALSPRFRQPITVSHVSSNATAN